MLYCKFLKISLINKTYYIASESEKISLAENMQEVKYRLTAKRLFASDLLPIVVQVLLDGKGR